MGVGALLFVYLSNTCFQNIQAHTRNYNIHTVTCLVDVDGPSRFQKIVNCN
jgi:hypothetical protein